MVFTATAKLAAGNPKLSLPKSPQRLEPRISAALSGSRARAPRAPLVSGYLLGLGSLDRFIGLLLHGLLLLRGPLRGILTWPWRSRVRVRTCEPKKLQEEVAHPASNLVCYFFAGWLAV